MKAHLILGQLILGLAFGIASASPADARITPQDYTAVEVVVPAGASLPLTVSVTDEKGSSHDLGSFLKRPTVLVFSDYTCRTLCGPTLTFVAMALEQSGLVPGAQFRLLVIGLDPKDSAADMIRTRRERIGAPLDSATTFVTADQPTITALTAAVGFHYRYDEDADQFVHAAAAFVVRPDGHVTRALTGIGLSAGDVRLALVEAGEGRIGTIGDRVRLLCSSFDPAHGTYNLLVSRLLVATGIGTIMLLGGGIGLLALAGRRRAA